MFRHSMMMLAAAGLLATLPATADPAPVTGRWLTEQGKALVEIAPCGQSVCGRIVKILKPRGPGRPTDIHNPDKALRNRPIEGLTILSGLTPGKTRWDGRIYDPESGRTYRSELSREGSVLKVKGCWGPFCKSQQWTRAG